MGEKVHIDVELKGGYEKADLEGVGWSGLAQFIKWWDIEE